MITFTSSKNRRHKNFGLKAYLDVYIVIYFWHSNEKICLLIVYIPHLRCDNGVVHCSSVFSSLGVTDCLPDCLQSSPHIISIFNLIEWEFRLHESNIFWPICKSRLYIEDKQELRNFKTEKGLELIIRIFICNQGWSARIVEGIYLSNCFYPQDIDIFVHFASQVLLELVWGDKFVMW